MSKDELNPVLRAGVLPIDENTGLSVCPPPREIICIKVDKVYNECKQAEVNQLTFNVSPPVKADEVECINAKVENVRCEVEKGTVTVTFDLFVTFKLLQQGKVVATITEKALNETKTVRLARAGEKGLECEVDIFPECLLCFISGSNPSGNVHEVTCCVGKLFVFKLIAKVQVLVPSFGFCPEPLECEAVSGICPDFNPAWPPYPPQNDPGEHGGCGCD